MHGWMIYPHRVKNLRLPLPDVNYSQEPVDVFVIYGDDHFVQSEDIEMQCPPTDIVESVGTTFSQLAVKICVGHPAFGSADGLWFMVCSTCANTLAPPLKPISDHFAAKPCCFLEAFEFFESDIQAIYLSATSPALGRRCSSKESSSASTRHSFANSTEWPRHRLPSPACGLG
jgi:hypothetical protein